MSWQEKGTLVLEATGVHFCGVHNYPTWTYQCKYSCSSIVELCYTFFLVISHKTKVVEPGGGARWALGPNSWPLHAGASQPLMPVPPIAYPVYLFCRLCHKNIAIMVPLQPYFSAEGKWVRCLWNLHYCWGRWCSLRGAWCVSILKINMNCTKHKTWMLLRAYVLSLENGSREWSCKYAGLASVLCSLELHNSMVLGGFWKEKGYK